MAKTRASAERTGRRGEASRRRAGGGRRTRTGTQPRTVDPEVELDLQAGRGQVLPRRAELRKWVITALRAGRRRSAQLTLRFVGAAEGRRLNESFRPGKSGPTNVLSFPAPELPPLPADAAGGLPPLGDIVICLPVVRREAAAQGKRERAHLAHLVLHGCLHLLGHTHDGEEDTAAMMALERKLMKNLGFPDPYAEE